MSVAGRELHATYKWPPSPPMPPPEPMSPWPPYSPAIPPFHTLVAPYLVSEEEGAEVPAARFIKYEELYHWSLLITLFAFMACLVLVSDLCTGCACETPSNRAAWLTEMASSRRHEEEEAQAREEVRKKALRCCTSVDISRLSDAAILEVAPTAAPPAPAAEDGTPTGEPPEPHTATQRWSRSSNTFARLRSEILTEASSIVACSVEASGYLLDDEYGVSNMHDQYDQHTGAVLPAELSKPPAPLPKRQHTTAGTRQHARHVRFI